MTKKSKPEQAAKPAQAKRAASPKRPKKSAALKIVDGEAAPAAKDFDFVGKVESIRAGGAAGAGGFEFVLRGRHDARQTVRLNPSEPFMAPAVVSAHAAELRLGVRLEQREDGVPVVVELALRPGLGKKG